MSMNFLYIIIGGLLGVNWQEIARQKRTEILLRLEDMGHALK